MTITTEPRLHTPTALFCKTYAGDLQRVKRLLNSIGKYNRDRIPTFVSIPSQDFQQLHNAEPLVAANATLITDESIIHCGGNVGLPYYRSWDGRLSQQVIKSEFWRYFLANYSVYSDINYVCIDSESEFIRDFYTSDFISPSGAPYTICHDHQDLITIARQINKKKVEENFIKDCSLMKEVFSRGGPDYAFSPTPVIWSSKVWRDLDDLYLKPNGINLWDAIAERPNELHWYGEALLHFKSIPLIPRSPLFRVYHYDWEFFSRKKSGETIDSLKQYFLGVHKQSNWDFESDEDEYPKKRSMASRLRRQIRWWYLNNFG